MVDSSVNNTANPVAIDSDVALGALLAGLRLLHHHLTGTPLAAGEAQALEAILTNGGLHRALDASEIEALCEGLNERCKNTHPAFVVLQEGGTSSEIYVTSHGSEEEAEDARVSCRDHGSYRTSPVIEVPAVLAAHGEELYDLLDAIARAEFDYPDGDFDTSDDE